MDGASARGNDSRHDLLDTAIDCFARFGYQATSIDRIAREAGVTKGALYYHFKDKEHLLFEAVKNRVGQWERRVVEDVRPAPSAAGRLRQVADVCLEHATKSNHRRMIVTLMVEALDHSKPLSAEFRGMMDRFRLFLRQVIESGQHRGEFRADVDAALAAQVYAGAVMGAEIQYYQDPDVISLRDTLAAFVEPYLAWLARDAGGPDASLPRRKSSRARPAPVSRARSKRS